MMTTYSMIKSVEVEFTSDQTVLQHAMPHMHTHTQSTLPDTSQHSLPTYNYHIVMYTRAITI